MFKRLVILTDNFSQMYSKIIGKGFVYFTSVTLLFFLLNGDYDTFYSEFYCLFFNNDKIRSNMINKTTQYENRVTFMKFLN